MFSNKDLKNLIVPLFLEQLLMALVGIADVFVIGFVGEAAVSGVSLVNSFNTIFLNLFTALASGGAVVISQYIGHKDKEHAGQTASQLLTASVILSVAISVVILLTNASLMRLMFGKVDADVMDACVTYLRISAYSYPALAIYNAGAALYRSFGKTSTTMYISILANIINVIGNCIGVFGLHAGVVGVAVPSLVSRCFSAVVMFFCKKSCQLPWLLDHETGCQSAEKNPPDRGSERSGEWCVPTCKSCPFQCGCTVWNVSDRSEWRGAEYLESGGTCLCDDGTGIYHSHWTMHGSR